MRWEILLALCSCLVSATTASVPSRIQDIDFAALIADKAFDSNSLRATLNERGAIAVIPSKADRKTPIPHDLEMYKWRHLVENRFQGLKEFRRVATGYDKTDTSFTAAVRGPVRDVVGIRSGMISDKQIIPYYAARSNC
jgi:transposase